MHVKQQQKLAQTMYGYKPKDKFVGFGIVVEQLKTTNPFKISTFDFYYPNIKV